MLVKVSNFDIWAENVCHGETVWSSRFPRILFMQLREKTLTLSGEKATLGPRTSLFGKMIYLWVGVPILIRQNMVKPTIFLCFDHTAYNHLYFWTSSCFIIFCLINIWTTMGGHFWPPITKDKFQMPLIVGLRSYT